VGLVDDAHTPFAQFLEDLIVRERLADHAESLLKHVLDKHELRSHF
jgi:hypothetical protein